MKCYRCWQHHYHNGKISSLADISYSILSKVRTFSRFHGLSQDYHGLGSLSSTLKNLKLPWLN